MYSELLDKKKFDVLTMLDYCYTSGKKEVSVNELAAFFNAGQQKIYTLIDILTQEMEEMDMIGEKTFSFKLGSNSQIHFSFSSNYTANQVYLRFLQKSINFIFLQDLFTGKFSSQQRFAIEHQMSTKTLNRKLASVHDLLEEYGIDLNLKCRDPLQGAEYQIRYFYTLLNWQTYQERPQTQQVLDKAGEDVLEHFAEKYLPNLQLIKIRECQYALLTMVTRCNQGRVITVLPKGWQEVSNLFYTYEQFRDECFIPFLQTKNMHQFAGVEMEAQFYYAYFSSMIIYLPEELAKMNYGLTKSKVFNCELTNKFIESFCRYFSLSLDQETYIYLVYNLNGIHYFCTMLKGSYVAFGRKGGVDHFFHQFPHLYSEVQEFFLKELTDEAFQQAMKNNSRLLYHYCMLVRPILIKNAPPLRVAIASKVSKLQTDWQKQELKQMMMRPLVFVNEGELADILITDFPTGEAIPYKGKPELFNWSPIQTDADWIRLRDQIDALSFRKKKEGMARVSRGEQAAVKCFEFKS